MESIKFSDAILIMNTGDVFSPDSSDYDEFILLENGAIVGVEEKQDLILCKDFFGLIGQIIPAKKEMISLLDAQNDFHKETDIAAHFGNNTPTSVSLIFSTISEHFWRESEQNRDILYADLMKMCNKFFIVGSEEEQETARVKFIEEIEKINDVLNPDTYIQGT